MDISTNQLLAAGVEIDITPPVGYGFDGYGARVGKSLGIYDPLLAQLLLLKLGDRQVILISLDLLGIGLDFTNHVRTGIKQAIGVQADSILIACSHTHSGAAGFLPPHPGITTSIDAELQQVVARQLVGSAIWANQKLEPARLGAGQSKLEGIGLNRNDPALPVDQEVSILRVDTLSGKPIAVLMNYGCHPTVLGYQNLKYSADYPGAARALLHKIYPKTVFMFTNGASGDVSTRFSRRDQSFAEVERMGYILGGETLKVMQTILTQPTQKLETRNASIELNFRPFPSANEALGELGQLQAELEALKASGATHGEIRKAITKVEGATGQAMMAKELEGRSSNKSQIQVVEIGDLALVGLPGEPFTRTVLDIKQKSLQPTAVVSYANDYQGYFPDSTSIALGSYEALISPYGADVSNRLRDVAIELLGRRSHV
jgi:neutral ceramidase